MPKVGWNIDLTKCIGCHACYVACKAENRTPLRTDWRKVIMRESGTYPNVKREFISLSCNHCDQPACLKSCPTGAITKRAEAATEEARARAEHALAELRAYQTALDKHAIVAVTDPSGTIKVANDRFCDVSQIVSGSPGMS